MTKTGSGDSFCVQFEGGLEMELVIVAGTVVARPHCLLVEGARVFVDNGDCGIGVVSGGSGLFPSVLGAEYNASLSGAVGLPEAIEVSLLAPDGTWFGRDVTDAILSMDYEDILALEDCRIPEALSKQIGEPYVTVEIAAAVSFYFGRMPQCEGGLAKVSQDISRTDLEQARIVRRWQALAPEMTGPSFSPFG